MRNSTLPACATASYAAPMSLHRGPASTPSSAVGGAESLGAGATDALGVADAGAGSVLPTHPSPKAAARPPPTRITRPTPMKSGALLDCGAGRGAAGNTG